MNLPGGWELVIAVLVVPALLVLLAWGLSPRASQHRPSTRTADDDAVAAARAALTAHWRSTVVAHEDGGWTVRTWTSTPAAASRPTGSPDFVHRVAPRSGSRGPGVTQVHP